MLRIVFLSFPPKKEEVRAGYLTIIPRAQMGYETIAHEAEWAMRARGIIVLVKSN